MPTYQIILLITLGFLCGFAAAFRIAEIILADYRARIDHLESKKALQLAAKDGELVEDSKWTEEERAKLERLAKRFKDEPFKFNRIER